MNDKPVSKWALPFWTGGALLFGLASVYGSLRGGFQKYELAFFVFFAYMAVDTWRKRRKRKQG